MYQIKVTETYGRGLYATKHLPLGTTVTECELLVLSEMDSYRVNHTDLKHYTFKYDDKRDCLVLGDGEIFNHSSSPNVAYGLVNVGDRHVMSFVTLRDVEPGEQLFIDYSQDQKVDLSEYNVNLVG